MQNDRVDELLRLAWLEGWINTHGAYETAVQRRTGAMSVSAESSDALLKRLELALAETKPAMPVTIGNLLRNTRTTYLLRPQEILSRIGVEKNIYRLMEHDAISPLKISREAWRRLMTLFNLSADDLAGMIRRTQQLVAFRPSFKQVLARYSGRKKHSVKTATLEQAYTEMYAKAKLQLSDKEEQELNSLFEYLREGR